MESSHAKTPNVCVTLPRFHYTKKLETSDVWRNEMRDSKLPKRQYTEDFKTNAPWLTNVGFHCAHQELHASGRTPSRGALQRTSDSPAYNKLTPFTRRPVMKVTIRVLIGPISILQAQVHRLGRPASAVAWISAPMCRHYHHGSCRPIVPGHQHRLCTWPLSAQILDR